MIHSHDYHLQFKQNSNLRMALIKIYIILPVCFEQAMFSDA